MKTQSVEEQNIALARGSVYKLLSQALLYPDDEFYELLDNGRFEAELEACWRHIRPAEELPEGFDVFQRNQLPDSLETVQEEYIDLFTHTITRSNAPYESGYGQSHIFQQTECLADIAGFFRAFGLDVSDDAGERHDHIGIELEFMHFLACQEAHALQEKGPEELTIVREAQRDFFADHLGRWAPHFFKSIEERSTGFFRGVVLVALDFLQNEFSRLGVQPAEMDFAASVDMPGDDAAPLCMTNSDCPGNPVDAGFKPAPTPGNEEDFS